MAETLISPGVLARENDQSQVTSQPVQAGACLVGPTVLGRAGVPKLVTSYSEYLTQFGSTFESGSDTYSYFTSISAYNYFNNGGTSLIINRVVSGSFSQANTTTDPIRNDEQSTLLNTSPFSFTGSIATSGQGGTSAASPFVGVTVEKNGAATTGTTFNVSRGIELGKLTSDTAATFAPSLLTTVNGGTVPTNLLNGTYDGVSLSATGVTAATANFTVVGNALTVATLATAGSGYANNTTVSFPAGTFGTGALKTATAITSLFGAASTGLATVNAALPVTAFTTTGTASPLGTLTANMNKLAGKLFLGADLKIVGGAVIPASTTTATNGTVTLLLDSITGQVSSTGSGGEVTITAAGGFITKVEVSATGGALYANNTTILLTATGMNTTSALTNQFGAIGGVDITLVLQGALDVATECTAISVTGGLIANAGKGYAASDRIAITAATLGQGGTGTDATFQLVANDLIDSGAGSFTVVGGTTQATSNVLIEVTSVTLNTQNAADTFAINDVLTVTAVQIGNPLAPPGSQAPLTFTVTGADLIDDECFRLETLSDGTVMNSGTFPNPSTGKGTNGTLTLGTADNVRWEIQATDAATGTFSLIIRQGNDTATAKRVLEIFPNISLDPQSSNYIERVVGNQTKVLNGAGTSDPFISTQGSFPNASRYIRVSEVKAKTPNYFDNNGQPKAAFSGFLPDVASGSFALGEGALISTGTQELYYDAISDTNTQGIKAGDGGINQYTDAFNLLANKDDYSYNIISAPGLYYAASMMATPMNTLIQNTQTRGDAIAVVDLVSYSGGTVTTAKAQAASLDNSYAAAYWPWVQIIDPDTRNLVWTVPSSMIPGVYAYNDRTSEAWFAPAGINRGGLGTVVQAQRKLTQTNRDDLYTGKVNPIATFPGKGVVVFGQKTLQTQASALDRINADACVCNVF